MTALQICKAALERIEEGTPPQATAPWQIARAALEAAAKVGGLADDEALIEHLAKVPLNGVTMHLAYREATCVLIAIDAYLQAKEKARRAEPGGP